jgi:hypothetical protein
MAIKFLSDRSIALIFLQEFTMVVFLRLAMELGLNDEEVWSGKPE